MSKRKPMSKRMRFAVFKRDKFTCQYCGATPPNVTLEVDHIDPLAGGGADDETNLVTACMNCNRGKSDIPLSVVPQSLAVRSAQIAEAEEQLAGYRAVIQDQLDRREEDAWQVVEILAGKRETTHARFNSVVRFLDRLDLHDLLSAATTTRGNMSWYGQDRRFRYFYSICWRMISEAEDGQN